MKLSILICHLEDRKPLLDRLMACLNPQINPDVEVLVETDSGALTTGAKRNILLDKALGDFISFVDDDDLLSPRYVSQILTAIDKNPDVVGMEGLLIRASLTPRKFIHSIRYKSWFEEKGIYYRPPNHLNPVRRALALQTKFPDKKIGEDRDYSMRLMPLLKTEVMVDSEPLYFYYP